VLLFDVPPEVGLARADSGGEKRDSIGQESLDFHRRVREGFLEIARAEPGRVMVIDATQPEVAITEAVWAAVERAMSRERA
jgi:dTMP kinase